MLFTGVQAPVRLSVALLFFALPGLSGCSLFGTKTDYDLKMAGTDKDTEQYLRKILKERADDKTGDLSKRPDVRARQESYIEETLKIDLIKGLKAKGYYDPAVNFADSSENFSGEYKIDPGPRYKIASFASVPREYQDFLDKTPLRNGQPLDAGKVLDAQSRVYKDIQKDHCYFSMDVQNQVSLDHTLHKGDIRFLVKAGPEGNFGPVSFKGVGTVRENYLKKLVPWKRGDCFRREKLEQFKTSLLQSGLFSRADAILPQKPLPDGSVPITIDLTERPHRTVSAGATYYSDEGPGILLGWEHRNFFGSAEDLKANLTLSQLKQSLDLDFTKPFFMRKDQSLSLNTSVRRQETDAFNELGFEIGGAVNRNFTARFSGSTGVSFEGTRIEDEGDEDKNTGTFGLLSFPQGLTYDNRDNKLDARKGFVLSASAEPFFDVLGEASPFIKTSASGSTYLGLGTPLDLVFATKAGIGSILGNGTEEIPATERFYAGGGGSVRGYGYQEVGPFDDDGDPTGGRSLVNGSLELRSKFTETLGGVAFVDAGSVSESINPSFDNFAIGAGIGARYFTSFGPLRFDIAVPLTEKENLDQNYQFYISIGQAF